MIAAPKPLSEVGVESLPFASEAEQSIIGAILMDNEHFHRVSDIIRPEHFYNPVHSRMFQVIGASVSAGRMMDGIQLKARFANDEVLNEVGGVEYIALLMDMSFPLMPVREYAKLVRDCATRRALMSCGSELFHAAADVASDASPSDIVSEAEADLFALGETGTARKTTFTLGEAMALKIESMARASASGGMAGLATGLSDLDAILRGLAPGNLYILAGRPGMGKSALAITIARNLARDFRGDKAERKDGGRTALFSLEMSAEQMSGRIISMESRVPAEAIHAGNVPGKRYQDVVDAVTRLNAWPLAIDETGAISLERLSRIARRQQRLNGLDLVIVDYLQLMTPPRHTRSMGRTSQVDAISAGLKALAKDLGVPVLALAQLSRAVEQRENKRPMLSDLRESGAIEQDADVVMFAYRPEYYLRKEEPEIGHPDRRDWERAMQDVEGVAEIIVDKNRHGRSGTAHAEFVAHLTEFRDRGATPSIKSAGRALGGAA